MLRRVCVRVVGGRFAFLFKRAFPKMELVTCGKKRDPNDPSKRTVIIQVLSCVRVYMQACVRACVRACKCVCARARVRAYALLPRERTGRGATLDRRGGVVTC